MSSYYEAIDLILLKRGKLTPEESGTLGSLRERHSQYNDLSVMYFLAGQNQPEKRITFPEAVDQNINSVLWLTMPHSHAFDNRNKLYTPKVRLLLIGGYLLEDVMESLDIATGSFAQVRRLEGELRRFAARDLNCTPAQVYSIQPHIEPYCKAHRLVAAGPLMYAALGKK